MGDTIKNTKMQKFDDFLNRNVVRAIYIIQILLVIGFFKGCEYSRSVKITKSNTAVTINRLDSIIQTNPDMTWIMRIQQLQFEKVTLENARNMLFNESAIDQRKLTPDQVLNEYNMKIELLDIKIKDLYEQK